MMILQIIFTTFNSPEGGLQKLTIN